MAHTDTLIALYPDAVLLTTCNRIELYAATKQPDALVHDLQSFFGSSFSSYFDADAFYHLCRVAAGLDSAILGETHIQNQVKRAYEAKEGASLPSLLHFAFQKALKIAKNVRSRFPHVLTSSMAPTVLELARAFFKDEPLAVPLFIGASKINFSLAQEIFQVTQRPLAITNRTPEKALAWQNHFPVQIIPFEELSHCWKNYKWIISAVKAPALLIDDCSKEQRLFIDLSVPRTIAATKHGTLYTIEDITSFWKHPEATPPLISEAEHYIQTVASSNFFHHTPLRVRATCPR